jgi:hypothetical protein
MSGDNLRSIAGETFRASPRYRLIARPSLDRDLTAAVAGFLDDPDFYGVLLDDSEVTPKAKAVCGDTARLFLACSVPGPIPHSVSDRLEALTDGLIAKLVLDGVLEIRTAHEFVSGPDAFRFLFDRPPHYPLPGRTGALTLAALNAAQAYEGVGVSTLARFLYRYNTVAASPRWQRRFPSSATIADHLCTPLLPWTSGHVHAIWTMLEVPAADSPWLAWKRCDAEPAGRGAPGVIHCKLYISPACEVIREAFHATVSVLVQSRAVGFKVGRDLFGLLRPDKLVAYFSRFEDLDGAAARLAAALGGMPSHGVPFTAALTDDGLLSWGIDPGSDIQTFGWHGAESWRAWVTNRLAEPLQSAQASPALDVPPWLYALANLDLLGIEPTSFTPRTGAWSFAAGSEPL